MGRYKQCKCGCGELSRGEFKAGHSQITGYRVRDYKRIHRTLAEKALGKPLPIGAEVHHVDLTKSEKSSLIICQDHSYHILLHVRTRILKAGGNPNTNNWCSSCKQPRSKDKFYTRRTTSGSKKAGTPTTICKECSNKRSKYWKRLSRAKAKASQMAV